MQHLSAAVPGFLEPSVIRRDLQGVRAQIERLESVSLSITTGERARELRQEGAAVQDRLVRLARAGYAPLCIMPWGSYVASDFDAIGREVSELLRRLRRVMDHCQQLENMALLRDQADADREHRRRFPDELVLLETHREILAALYPDRWLLLFDGAIRGEFDTAHQAVQAGEQSKGRDEASRPLFLVFCHRSGRA